MDLNPLRLFRRQPAAAVAAAHVHAAAEPPAHESERVSPREVAATNAAVKRLHHYVAMHGDLRHLLPEEQRAAELADPAVLLRRVDRVAAEELEREGSTGADLATRARDTLVARFGSADPDDVRLAVLDRYDPDPAFGNHIGEAAADLELLVSHDYRGDADMAQHDHPDIKLRFTDREAWEQLQDERTIASITGIPEPDGHYVNRARGLLVQNELDALAAGDIDRSTMSAGDYRDWPHREKAIEEYRSQHPDRVQPGRANDPAELARLADYVDARVAEAQARSREAADVEREAYQKERRERYEAAMAELGAVEAWEAQQEDPETAWHRSNPEEGFAQGYLTADEAARGQAFSEAVRDGAWDPKATPEAAQAFHERVDQRAQELLHSPAYQPREADGYASYNQAVREGVWDPKGPTPPEAGRWFHEQVDQPREADGYEMDM